MFYVLYIYIYSCLIDIEYNITYSQMTAVRANNVSHSYKFVRVQNLHNIKPHASKSKEAYV